MRDIDSITHEDIRKAFQLHNEQRFTRVERLNDGNLIFIAKKKEDGEWRGRAIFEDLHGPETHMSSVEDGPDPEELSVYVRGWMKAFLEDEGFDLGEERSGLPHGLRIERNKNIARRSILEKVEEFLRWISYPFTKH